MIYRPIEKDFIKKYGKREFNYVNLLVKKVLKIDPNFARVDSFDTNALLVAIWNFLYIRHWEFYIKPQHLYGQRLFFDVRLKDLRTGYETEFGGVMYSLQVAVLTAALVANDHCRKG